MLPWPLSDAESWMRISSIPWDGVWLWEGSALFCPTGSSLAEAQHLLGVMLQVRLFSSAGNQPLERDGWHQELGQNEELWH